MISIDSKLFKQVAEKFAQEINEKYCPETKVKHSFALEALSHAFGFKDYNTIKPKLDETTTCSSTPIATMKDLVEKGYEDIKQFKLPINALTAIAQRQLFKELFLQLAYFYKNLANYQAQKYYYSFETEEFPDYANVVYAVSTCLGAKFEYFLVDTKVVIYWEFRGFVFNVGLVAPSLEKGTCMQIFNKGERATQCVVQGLSEKGITVKLFNSFDGDLTDNTETFKEGERLYLTYNSDREMRMASMLVNDITNKEFEYAIFLSTFDGMIRARYVVQNHPNVAMYVLDTMYGYNPEFI